MKHVQKCSRKAMFFNFTPYLFNNNYVLMAVIRECLFIPMKYEIEQTSYNNGGNWHAYAN